MSASRSLTLCSASVCGAKAAPPSAAGWLIRLPWTAATTASALARGTGNWCTTATGACSQRPTHGAAITSMSASSKAGRRCSRSRAPASSQLRPSQTRTVSGRRVLALGPDLEVVVEGRDLVDLGHRHVGLDRERDEMALLEADDSDR